ncbi:hypothetical protein AVEN_49349-1 [Araneus ventricosus]|uniref:ribonuclease H n=1 Tax=Araneus ventricosus TaxID=182803 RepID=A0A4Y2LQF2_ARAVE|nr:hypothetical protein AVEN_49349-1 [Araneus ventricosus]
MESQFIGTTRLQNPPPPRTQLTPLSIENKIVGWSSHPSVALKQHQINLTDGGTTQHPFSIFTDGSKTEKGAELLAAKEAVSYAASIDRTTNITIHIDNQASLHSISNPKSPNSIARQIFSILKDMPNISLTWIKAHVGYIGNEAADTLAKRATETGDPFPQVEIPKSYLKDLLKKRMMDRW